ncbi:MAG: (Fe-S)-binding protein, partial [Thermodesulfobacteriota bacterium]|nr:(Fe-S)-binding protein [Thermodesulfobacteriota bacterium]
VMIRLHFFAVLFFIAIVPFTFMRHLAASALNVCYIKKGPRGELGRVSLDKGPLGVKSVRDFTWKQLLDTEACVSCGRCEEKCPASISGKPLSPQKVIRNILEQMEEVNVFLKVDPNRIRSANLLPPLIEDSITGDEIWSCTTCMACVEHCPVFIEPVDKIIDIRRYQVMRRGLLPAEARPMIRNLEIYGDAQGKGAAHRGDWAFNRNVPLISTEGLDAKILLWVGCSGAFHPIYQETIRAMVKILKYGRVRFGILDREELCCGDPARRMGEEALFLELAQKNIDLFYKYNIQKIVTLCPHCYNTLKNEYPCLEDDLRSGHGKGPRSGSGIGFEVIHATEFVMDLIKEKKISPRYPISKTITIHDPCYLGRINHIYKPLRELIKAVPGLELKEMKENRENGFCCGGGGGRMWLHERLGRHMNQIRAEEVVETGVDLLGTACPYCMTMLDDGLKALEIDRPPKVSDIIEILAHSLE